MVEHCEAASQNSTTKWHEQQKCLFWLTYFLVLPAHPKHLKHFTEVTTTSIQAMQATEL